MTKQQIIRRIHELRGELSLLQQQLGREHNLWWTDHLGWVSIPGPELEDETLSPLEQRKLEHRAQAQSLSRAIRAVSGSSEEQE